MYHGFVILFLFSVSFLGHTFCAPLIFLLDVVKYCLYSEPKVGVNISEPTREHKANLYPWDAILI